MINIRFLQSLLVFYFCTTGLSAQSIGALKREAERYLSSKDFPAAAAIFERAGRLNNNDPALLYRAAEAYKQARDYFNASNCYGQAMVDKRFQMAALYYARSLKQQSLYQDARAAFEQAGESYRGDHKALILQVIENEIAGCELATSYQMAQDSGEINTTISWMPPPVSSEENTFAPLPFSDTLLYFSVAGPEQSSLMRSSKRSGVWQTPLPAKGLPESASEKFLCGAFSVDGQRFYFSRCDGAPLAKQGSSVQTGNCDLYVLQLDKNGAWGEPARLRPYINHKDASNTWPFVCDYGREEWLFFASNRPGGMGGFDLYFCKRPLDSEEMDFSFPQNLGNQVNTGADETSPYYDVFSKKLWFSSLGHPGLGGLDVHFSTGEGSQWSEVENANIPINSPADDMYFVLKKDGRGAFLSSNRKVKNAKNTTANDALFEVFFQNQE